MKVDVQKEHEWLRQLEGEWTYEHEAAAAPGETPKKLTGTETVRMLGDVWAICEGSGEMPEGGTSRSIMTLGYDPQKGRFVGSFIASVMTFFWLYDGELDPSGRMLRLQADGPSFTTPGETVKYMDVIEIVSPDERLLRAQALQDGTWTEFMRATYRRRK